MAPLVDRLIGPFRSKVAGQAALGMTVWAVTFGAAKLAKLEEPLAVGLSFLVSGVVLVLQFLARLEKRQDQLQQTMDGIRRDLATAETERMELLGLVAETAVRDSAPLQLAKYTARIPKHPKLIHGLVQARAWTLSSEAKEIGAGGDLIIEGIDREWILALVAKAEESIDATSIVTLPRGNRCVIDGGLWHGDLGQRYLDEQAATAGRHREIRLRRIFIVDKLEVRDHPDFQQVCLWHVKRGSEVKVLEPTSVAAPLSSLFGFSIFDGVVSYEPEPRSPSRQQSEAVIGRTRLIFRPDSVRDRTRRFEELWDLATSL